MRRDSARKRRDTRCARWVKGRYKQARGSEFFKADRQTGCFGHKGVDRN